MTNRLLTRRTVAIGAAAFSTFLILSTFTILAADPARAKRGMVPEDLMRLQVVSALEVSPDGSRIVYALDRSDREKKGYTHAIFEMDPSSTATHPLTDPKDDCGRPRFSPDGERLAYLCTIHEGKKENAESQIYVARAGSRHGRRVTRIAEGVDDFAWSPDGTRFIIVRTDPPARRRKPGADDRTDAEGSSERPNDAPTPGKNPKADADAEDDEPDPIVITRTQIQSDGEGFLGDRRSHLWIVSADGKDEPRMITRGPYDDGSPVWSPDGRWIAFVSNRTKDPDTNDNTDIFAIQPDGTGLRTIAANPGPDHTPAWSHRGDRIAFLGQMRPNDYYQRLDLMVVPAEGGAPIDLTRGQDTWVSADALLESSSTYAPTQWSTDDTTLYVTLDRRGANYLASVPSAPTRVPGQPLVVTGAVKEILGGAYQLGQVRLAPSTASTAAATASRPPLDRFYFTLTDPTHMPEIHTARLDGTGLRKLGRVNDELFAELSLSTPRKIVAQSSGGTKVESWLYPPLDLDASRKYPLIVYLHGGPQGYDGDWFDNGLENQLFPANGYAVLRVNYRGSTSYGEDFCRALWGDWHWREHDDIMASVDEALKVGWLDGERLGIGGWSYGGIMTIWVAGHTDRFKVGVPERFEIDYLSCFGEDQWFTQYLEEMGSPLEHADVYRAHSPGTYVTAIKTPLYLISDEKDGNCPLPQAMQFYQRLKLLGVPTELVIYPREPHVMAEPDHLIDRLHRLLAWFGGALKKPSP